MKNYQKYKKQAEKILRELNQDEVAVKHIPCDDPLFQEGYINGYIVGCNSRDNDKQIKAMIVLAEELIKKHQSFLRDIDIPQEDLMNIFTYFNYSFGNF